MRPRGDFWTEIHKDGFLALCLFVGDVNLTREPEKPEGVFGQKYIKTGFFGFVSFCRGFFVIYFSGVC